MIEWDSELYLRYERERTQPSLDLAWRIPLPPPWRSSISVRTWEQYEGPPAEMAKRSDRRTRLFARDDRTGPPKLI